MREVRAYFKYLIAAIIVFLAIWFSVSNNPSISEFFYKSTNKVPTRLTELYFLNPETLPNSLAENEEFSFTFVIKNEEGKRLDYEYITYTEEGGFKTVFKEGIVSVDDNSKVKIQVNGTLEFPTKQKIVVELVQKEQSISFWINNR